MENYKIISLLLEMMYFIKIGVLSHQYSLELNDLSQYEDTCFIQLRELPSIKCSAIPDPPSVHFPPFETPILFLLIFLNLLSH